MSCTPSPTSSQYFTPPQSLEDGIIRFTTLGDGETGLECIICFQPLENRSLAGRVKIVSTHCGCTRINQLYHSVCLSRMIIEAPHQGERYFRCPFARHELKAGELQPIIDAYLHESTDGGSSASSHSPSSLSSSSDFQKPKVENGSDDSFLNYSPISSNGSMDAKTQEVFNMTVHFGAPRAEGQENPHRFKWGKGLDMMHMYEKFGQSQESDEKRDWKLVRLHKIMDDLEGSPSGSSDSLMLGYSSSDDEGVDGLSQEIFLTPEG